MGEFVIDRTPGGLVAPAQSTATTLVHVLRHHAAETPGRTAFRFLPDGESEGEALTYGELGRRSRALASELRRLAEPGERAILLFPAGLDFVVAFLGCLYAGVVAVPAYPPRGRRRDPRLQAICRDAEPALVLADATSRSRTERLEGSIPELARARWVSPEVASETAGAAEDGPEPDPAPGDLAFLQYTSGSTSEPKGVEVDHANLLHNERAIQEAFGQSAESVIVGWLPLYHDMGLIGNVLQPLYLGARCVLMPPMAFLQRPVRWLRAIERYGATTSGGPNFAYDLCARRIPPEEREGLDLSRWSVAFNGSEPVRAETLEAFARGFGPWGFRREAFLPCYGLAESTLFVTGAEPGGEPRFLPVDREALAADRAEEPVEGRPAEVLVGCGRPRGDHRVQVIEPASGRPCPPGRVGEVWVAGPSVARGYRGRPGLSRETFGAAAAGAGGGPWLRTGDLGFLDGGELFITGRLKELLIVRGRNLYPQDLERTARDAHPALASGAGAAFTVDAERGPGVVLVHEVERTWRRKAGDVPRPVARALAEEHQVPVEAVVLVRPGSVPRTTSGKIRRRETRARYLADELPEVAAWRRDDLAGRSAEGPTPPRTPTEERLAELWAEVLEVGSVDVHEDLFALGGDSLLATRIVTRIRQAFDVDLSLETLFEAPTVASLAEVLDEVEGPTVPAQAPPVRPGPPEAPAPLAFPQRRLWFLHRLVPDSPVHNIGAAVDLEGRLNPRHLDRAIRHIVQRHEALRTRFVDDGGGDRGEPAQGAAPGGGRPLPVVDLSGLPPARCPGELDRRARDLVRRPFRLDAGLLLRVALFRRSRHRHALALSFHHIAADGASLDVFLRETAELYEASRRDRPPRVPQLPVQYRDYARWQREWLRGKALRSRLAYWRERLAGAPGALELPGDRPRPPVQSHRGAHLERRLPRELSAGLEELARRHGATPFMAGLAAYLALLHRHTGETDLVVGTPVAGRVRPEVENLMGVFLNNLVLRVSVAGDPPFSTFLGRVREAALAAYAHQDLPFEVLVDELAPRRDRSRNPLFQVMFVGQNAPLEPMDLPGLRLEPRELDPGAARFDLSLSMAPGAAGWLGTWKYTTDLFDPTTVRRMARRYECLAGSILASPEAPLSALDPMSPAERHQVLRSWNDTDRPRRDARLLHELVAEQARRTPEAVALTDGSRHLTFDGLLRRARRLAWELAAAGAGPDLRVGVLAERSVELVLGLLAALEAGAAFLPLDPEDPPERLAFVLEDARPAALLAREGALRPAGSGAPVVPLATEPGGNGDAGAPPAAPATLDSAAYTLYTSGSTGRPKGVPVSHRAIVNRLLWMQEAFALDGTDRVLQKTPSTFDVSVWEFFWPLLAGATLVVAPPRAHRDGVRLAELVRVHRITTIHFVPSMLRPFLAAPEAAACASLRRVVASGEALDPELAARFRETSGAELHNLYGPTEAAVDVTAHRCTPADGSTLPIGRPIANLRVHVLDAGMRPAPLGVPGQLHIGGTGLARGYLGRPGLAAERFVPDPFQPVGRRPGGRLYATGDLARHGRDGAVEFLGRLDHQVKVRGVRIEPGEVEAILSAHPEVGEVVVAARSDAGEARLVAYVVPAEGAAPAPRALRGHAADRLPEALVPSAYVVLDALPRTASGKVDRNALPRPEAPGAPEAGPSEAPRTALERRLAALWEEVLGVERVGLDDDFFDLGGDSIRGALLANRLQRELGEVVYVMALFDAPTVRRLAEHLEERYPGSIAALGGGVGAAGGAVAEEAAAGPAALAEVESAFRRRLGLADPAPPEP
ncbi:MAG: amino acid adenylation domain-containing protein, partial [Thermoanaerobaculia bacterium]